MHTVNMLQAKSSLSRLVEAIEQGEEREIIIARNGRPAAKLDISSLPLNQSMQRLSEIWRIITRIHLIAF